MNRLLDFILCLIITALFSCNSNKTNKTTVDSGTLKAANNRPILKSADDSVILTELIRKVYKWRNEEPKVGGFEPKKSNAADTLYSSMDLIENADAVKTLEKTGFFAKDFLDNFRGIAIRMDKELRDGSSYWREGELSTFGDDADEWCSCQDNPDNYWKTMKITNIVYNRNDVSFKWTWGDDFFYKVRAKKENNVFKISYLEGFDQNSYNWEWAKTHEVK